MENFLSQDDREIASHASIDVREIDHGRGQPVQDEGTQPNLQTLHQARFRASRNSLSGQRSRGFELQPLIRRHIQDRDAGAGIEDHVGRLSVHLRGEEDIAAQVQIDRHPRGRAAGVLDPRDLPAVRTRE